MSLWSRPSGPRLPTVRSNRRRSAWSATEFRYALRAEFSMK
jgi:hypothetical protein